MMNERIRDSCTIIQGRNKVVTKKRKDVVK